MLLKLFDEIIKTSWSSPQVGSSFAFAVSSTWPLYNLWRLHEVIAMDRFNQPSVDGIGGEAFRLGPLAIVQLPSLVARLPLG